MTDAEKLNKIGEVNYNNSGEKMTIIEFKNKGDLVVQFENGMSMKTKYSNFLSGGIRNPVIRVKNKIGEIKHNKYGSRMEITEYIEKDIVIVKFEDGYTIKSRYGHFKRGVLVNPYDKSVCGIGYIGEGEHVVSKNGIHTQAYRCWHSMIMRCYDEINFKKQPTYKDCYVSEFFHNYQNYAKWYNENYYEVGTERMEVDKDVLTKGNKVYSVDTCVFVPQHVNTLFTKANAIRGDTPIGCTFSKRDNRYKAQCYYFGKNVHLGSFNNETDCFNSYKVFKEKYIKEVADLYKDKIPQKLYDALYRYQVEITD